MLSIAIFIMPSDFYVLLRYAVFLGAVLVVINTIKLQLKWAFVFLIVGLVFNPIYPIYLYNKSPWILIDIITALLFLFEVLTFNDAKSEKKELPKKINQKSRSRDRIY